MVLVEFYSCLQVGVAFVWQLEADIRHQLDHFLRELLFLRLFSRISLDDA